jgi:hypothetical protein
MMVNYRGICFITLTPDYPVEKIPFPTVTVCPQQNDFNPLGFITKIMDYANFPPTYDG